MQKGIIELSRLSLNLDISALSITDNKIKSSHFPPNVFGFGINRSIMISTNIGFYEYETLPDCGGSGTSDVLLVLAIC